MVRIKSRLQGKLQAHRQMRSLDASAGNEQGVRSAVLEVSELQCKRLLFLPLNRSRRGGCRMQPLVREMEANGWRLARSSTRARAQIQAPFRR